MKFQPLYFIQQTHMHKRKHEMIFHHTKLLNTILSYANVAV